MTEQEELQYLRGIYHASEELIELLREFWKAPDADAMSLFMTAIINGIAENWAKNPPENGIVHYATWPGIGSLEIQIRKIGGKSAAQSILELQDQLKTEKDTRVKYQDIVYKVCNFLDVALGNSPSRGTGVLADEKEIMVGLTRLFHERKQG